MARWDRTMDLQAAWIVVRREKIERSRRTRFIFPSAFVDMAEFVSWPAVHQASSTSLELWTTSSGSWDQ